MRSPAFSPALRYGTPAVLALIALAGCSDDEVAESRSTVSETATASSTVEATQSAPESTVSPRETTATATPTNTAEAATAIPTATVNFLKPSATPDDPIERIGDAEDNMYAVDLPQDGKIEKFIVSCVGKNIATGFERAVFSTGAEAICADGALSGEDEALFAARIVAGDIK